MVTRELLQLARDPVALVLTFVAPVAAAVIASAALGSPTKVDATVVVVTSDADLGDTTSLTRALSTATGDKGETLTWEFVADESAARELVEDGDAEAALIMAPTDGDPHIDVIANRNSRLVGYLAASGARALASRIEAAAALDEFAEGAASSPAPVDVVISEPDREPLSGPELYGPVIGVFFLFLTAGFVARGLQDERELGTLHRLRAIPIGSTTIATGKVATMLIVGVVEFATVLVTMAVFFDAHWGNFWALLAVAFALALGVGGLALLMASFATTPIGAHALEVGVALGFAALGGYLVPLQNLPDGARAIALVMPNGIAIAAMRDIAANDAHLDDVTGSILAILAFALIFGAIGFVRVRRVVEA